MPFDLATGRWTPAEPKPPLWTPPEFASVVKPPSNNPVNAVLNAQTRLNYSGLPVPQEEKPGFGQLLFKALDVLDRPRNALMTGVKYANTPESPGFVEGLKRGFTGAEKTLGSDFIPESAPPWLRTAAGFGIDVVADPLTYLTAGSAKLGQISLTTGAKAAAKEFGLADKLRQALGAAPGTVIGKEAVQGFATAAREAAPLAAKAAKQAQSGLRKSTAHFLPGVDPADVTGEKAKGLGEFIKTKLDEIAGSPTLDSGLASKFGGTIPESVAKLDPKDRALAGYLHDLFGPSVDAGLAAERVGLNASKYKGVGLGKLTTRAEGLATAKSAAKKAADDLSLADELSAAYDKSTGRYFLKWMGQPIVDIAPVGRAAVDKVFRPLYNKSKTVQKLTDTWGELFLPHYLRLSETVRKGVGPQLGVMEQIISRLIRSENALPIRSAESAARLFGDQFFSRNPELDKVLFYYGEHKWFKSALPELEAAVVAGKKGAKLELAAAKEAVGYWESIAAKFTPEDLAEMDEALKKWSIMGEALATMDTASRREYDKLDYAAYFPHVYRTDDSVVDKHLRVLMSQQERISKKLGTGLMGSEKHRKFLSLAYAKKLGLQPIDSAAASIATRVFKSERAKLHAQLADDLLKLPSIVRNKPNKEFVPVGGMVPRLVGKHVHPEVARHLKRLDYTFFTDGGFSTLAKWLTQTTNLIKATQVGYNPSFTIRNIVGEGLMNFFAGVLPEHHKLAVKALSGSKDMITLAGKEVPLQQIIREFQDQGGWYAGVSRGNLAQKLEDITRQEVRVLQGGSRSPVNLTMPTKYGKVLNPSVIRDTSDYFDKLYRLAHYIDGRAKGYGAEEAMGFVRKFHVDYQDLTASEKAIWRNVVPYYTYFRKNLPIQLRIMLEQPGYLTAVAKLVNNSSNSLGNPTLSRYATENMALPLYRKDNGDVVVLNWNLPIADLGRVHFDLQGNMREQLGSLNPVLRVPFETVANRSLSTDRPIERFEGEQVPLFTSWQDGPKVGAKMRHALSQALGTFLSVPSSAAGALTGSVDEREAGGDRPRQFPVINSLLPVQRPSTAYQASQYRYRDKLIAAIRAAEGQGKVVPTMQEIRSQTKGRPWTPADLRGGTLRGS